MIWHWLKLSKFFGRISNYFYHKHYKALKTKQGK